MNQKLTPHRALAELLNESRDEWGKLALPPFAASPFCGSLPRRAIAALDFNPRLPISSRCDDRQQFATNPF
jgi:hypothetical protein